MTLPDFNKIVKSIDVVQNSGSGFLLFLYVCLDLVYRFYNFGTKINTSIKLGPESWHKCKILLSKKDNIRFDCLIFWSPVEAVLHLSILYLCKLKKFFSRTCCTLALGEGLWSHVCHWSVFIWMPALYVTAFFQELFFAFFENLAIFLDLIFLILLQNDCSLKFEVNSFNFKILKLFFFLQVLGIQDYLKVLCIYWYQWKFSTAEPNWAPKSTPISYEIFLLGAGVFDAVLDLIKLRYMEFWFLLNHV